MINNEIEKIENLIYVNLVDFDISEYSSFRLKYGFSCSSLANMSYSEGLIVVIILLKKVIIIYLPFRWCRIGW